MMNDECRMKSRFPHSFCISPSGIFLLHFPSASPASWLGRLGVTKHRCPAQFGLSSPVGAEAFASAPRGAIVASAATL